MLSLYGGLQKYMKKNSGIFLQCEYIWSKARFYVSDVDIGLSDCGIMTKEPVLVEKFMEKRGKK